jgi:hypothetical protein
MTFLFAFLLKLGQHSNVFVLVSSLLNRVALVAMTMMLLAVVAPSLVIKTSLNDVELINASEIVNILRMTIRLLSSLGFGHDITMALAASANNVLNLLFRCLVDKATLKCAFSASSKSDPAVGGNTSSNTNTKAARSIEVLFITKKESILLIAQHVKPIHILYNLPTLGFIKGILNSRLLSMILSKGCQQTDHKFWQIYESNASYQIIAYQIETSGGVRNRSLRTLPINLLLPEENYILGALLVHIRIYSHANGVLGSYTLLLTVTAKVGLGKDGHVVVVIHGSPTV